MSTRLLSAVVAALTAATVTAVTAVTAVTLTTAAASPVGSPRVSPVSSPRTSSERAVGVRVSPERFVGGQALTFSGRLPDAPGATLRLQSLFGRAGDSWTTLPGVVGRSGGDGSFQFTYPAPNNFGIRYRVKAVGGPAGSAIVLEPRQQEIALRVNGGRRQQGATVVSGEQFTIDVSTTPPGDGAIDQRPPVFPGRPLTLQQRVAGNTWTTIATAAASAQGTASFSVTAGSSGAAAYRVREEAISTDGNAIGWFPSYPIEVRVVTPGAGRASTPTRTAPAVRTAEAPPADAPLPRAAQAAQAGQRYHWGPTLYDFAWEQGESLTDKPYRGSGRTGSWIDRSNGSGRVAHYNGGMALSTHYDERAGKGDHGTTSATLEGNALTYGRWEFRRRIDVFEKGRQHRIKIELVPARPEDAGCGANTITVSDVAFNSRTARLGVTSSSGTRAWAGSRRIPRLGSRAHVFGIEVTRDHITWFLDGRSLATVRNKGAVPGVPLTPKLSLVGAKQKEMARTRVLYDWQRAWPLNKQARKAQSGPALPGTPVKSPC